LLQDEPLRRTLTEASRQQALAELSLNKHTNRIEQVLGDALSATASAQKEFRRGQERGQARLPDPEILKQFD